MTIRVEREALLMVINTSFPSSSSCSQYINDEDEFVIVDSVPTKPLKSNDFFYSDLIPSSTEDDDLGSLCTLSTTSSVSSYDSSSDISTVDRRVSFASQIVTDVWTRERTLPEDVSNLYYSSLETQTFRQEYRLERKLLSELSIDPETFPVDDEDLSNLVAATTGTTSPNRSTGSNGRHRISRVCVVYNDKLETFSNPAGFLSKKATTQPSYLSTFSSSQQQTSCNNNGDIPSDFFDNDSFWSGSLTWY